VLSIIRTTSTATAIEVTAATTAATIISVAATRTAAAQSAFSSAFANASASASAFWSDSNLSRFISNGCFSSARISRASAPTPLRTTIFKYLFSRFNAGVLFFRQIFTMCMGVRVHANEEFEFAGNSRIHIHSHRLHPIAMRTAVSAVAARVAAGIRINPQICLLCVVQYAALCVRKGDANRTQSLGRVHPSAMRHSGPLYARC